MLDAEVVARRDEEGEEGVLKVKERTDTGFSPLFCSYSNRLIISVLYNTCLSK
jgi:hypothetical protein